MTRKAQTVGGRACAVASEHAMIVNCTRDAGSTNNFLHQNFEFPNSPTGSNSPTIRISIFLNHQSTNDESLAAMASHDEIWDDSALVNSWNEALAEYKKYHSIHAQGAALPEDVTADLKDQNAKPSVASTDAQQEGGDEVEEGEAMEEDDTAPTAAVGMKIVETPQPAAGPTTTTAASLPGPGPQLMLGSVQDEELKKLLMSWYYAGYYTGLYEGKQKALQEQAQK